MYVNIYFSEKEKNNVFLTLVIFLLIFSLSRLLVEFLDREEVGGFDYN